MPTHRSTQASRVSRPRHAASILVASDWAPIRAFDPLVAAAPEAVYGDLLPTIRAADLRLVNCECALTDAESPVWKSGAVFKGRPAHAVGLAVVPFEVACLGNNHVLDYGPRGLAETLRVLHRRGIKTVGAGLTAESAYAPLTVEVRGQLVHVVNISEGEDETASRGGPGVFGWDLPRAVETVERCKASGGVVVVVAHCGLEYVPYPPPYVVEAFRALADAGADAVVGHHPHVAQGLEWRGRTPILYSLGNFVFYQQTALYHRKVGFCATLVVERGRVARVDLHPYRITDTGLRSATPAEGLAFVRTMAKISRPFLKADGHVRAWNAYLEHYGEAGFRGEVETILERMRTEPRKGAAMFRNRVTTAQHVELWRTYLTRVVDGGRERFAREALRMVEEYFTREVAREDVARKEVRGSTRARVEAARAGEASAGVASAVDASEPAVGRLSGSRGAASDRGRPGTRATRSRPVRPA